MVPGVGVTQAAAGSSPPLTSGGGPAGPAQCLLKTVHVLLCKCKYVGCMYQQKQHLQKLHKGRALGAVQPREALPSLPLLLSLTCLPLTFSLPPPLPTAVLLHPSWPCATSPEVKAPGCCLPPPILGSMKALPRQECLFPPTGRFRGGSEEMLMQPGLVLGPEAASSVVRRHSPQGPHWFVVPTWCFVVMKSIHLPSLPRLGHIKGREHCVEREFRDLGSSTL